MANGIPEKPPSSSGGDALAEEYVLRSGVRSGLKREFVFALRAQAEIMAPMGRTRSGKIQRPSATSQDRTARRPVKLDAAGSPPKSSSPPEEASSLVAPIEDAPAAEAAMPLDRKDESILSATPEVPPSPIQIHMESMVGTPIIIADLVKDSNTVDVPSNSPTLTEEASPSVPPHMTPIEVVPVVVLAIPVNRQDGTIPAGTLESPLAWSPSPFQIEADTVVETPMDIDGQGKKSDAADLPPCSPVPSEEARPPLMAPVDTVLVVEPTIPVDRKDEPMPAIIQEVPPSPNQIETRAMVETPIKIDDQGRQMVEENGVLERPVKRFTRSSLKAPKEEPPTLMVEASSSTSGGSDGLEETKGDESDMGNLPSEPLRTTPKKKMELKMSKKIALTKFPSNIRELLGTRLLEGLSVQYHTRTFDKQGGLRGLIKDGGIICFCTSCNGSKAISAYQFEQHAGSSKKHPSDFICLENGNTLRDVIRACASAPLDVLESTIQNAISSVGVKSGSTCDKCKEPSENSHIGKLASICDSCLVAKLSPISPSPSQKIVSSAWLSKPASVPSSSDNTLMSTSQKKNSHGRMTRKDVRLHKLVFMDDILPDGTEVAYYARGQKLLEGYIKGSGIFCQCCSSVVSPSQFEAHAGWASRRKPYLNIYTSNGVSLHELSVSLSKGRKLSSRESDDLCRICADGGDLILCDICPRAFHKECVGLTSIPTGDWYCPCCQNMHQKEKFVEHNENAIAAGRVTGIDPIEQIFRRCIRIVKTPEEDASSCVLCRCHDFSKTGFGPRTVLLCDQCEKEFHVGCLKDHNMADLKELPSGTWFCSFDCSRIHAALQNLLLPGLEQLPVFHSDMIRRKQEEKGLNKDVDLDVRWRLLSGETTSPDSRLLLSQAVSIFHESFDPIIDSVTGKDLILSMVYGRDQEFGGMYCAVLTVNSTVVSAGIIRVLGCEVAEIPLVATSRESQGQGYFQSLFSCIERLLDSLKVKHLVLPAADEAESIWTKKFGFSTITTNQVEELTKGSRTMTFRGTSLLHKLVSNVGVQSELS